MENFKYFAFISYSHADKSWADWIHRSLEGYRVPADLRRRATGRSGEIPKKLFPIYRDRDELPASGGLTASLRAALRQSKFLIVICSPKSAHSHWVAEEIRYFKSLGEDRPSRVLPIIVDGRPNAEICGQECFPRTLRYALGADGQLTETKVSVAAADCRVHGDGKERALLKLIAGILQLNLDAVIKREQKRKMRRRLLMVSLLSVCLVVLLWMIDYNRLKVSYFGNSVDVYGVPTGIRDLSQEQVRRRSSSLRFETQRGKLRKVTSVNAFGHPVKDGFEKQFAASGVELFYDEQGDLEEKKYIDNNGQPTVTLEYSDDLKFAAFKQSRAEQRLFHLMRGDQLEYTSWISARPRALQSEFGKSFDLLANIEVRVPEVHLGKTAIQKYAFEYSDAGLVRKKMYLDYAGSPVADEDGVSGEKYKYQELMPNVVTYVDQFGKAITDKHGVAGVQRRVEDGVVVEETFFGAEGQPVRGEHGYASMKVMLDEWGNTELITIHEPSGDHALTPNFGAGTRYRHDENGLVVGAVLLGRDMKPFDSAEGYAEMRSSYDRFGYVVGTRFYSSEGLPTADVEGRFGWSGSNDAHGNLLDITTIGADGGPAPGPLGSTTVKHTYDQSGNRVLTKHLDALGHHLNCSEGWSTRFEEYDRSGKLVRVEYLDAAGHPAYPTFSDGPGIPIVEMAYDPKTNNLSSQKFFSGDDRPTLAANGAHEFAVLYDDRGNLAESRALDTDGKPVTTSGGFATIKFEDQGDRTVVSVFGSEGEAVAPKGAHKVVVDRNAVGLPVRRRAFGVDGRAALEVVYLRANGRTISGVRAYDGDGGPLPIFEGVCGYDYTVSERGDVTQVTAIGTEGLPIADNRGIVTYKYLYSRRGLPIYMEGFDASGEPAADVDGIHRVELDYDARGNVTEARFYNLDGALIRNPAQGASIIKFQTSAAGVLTEQRNFDVHAKPVLGNEGWHCARVSWSDNGATETRTYYDTSLQPIDSPFYGCQKVVVELDQYGRKRSQTAFSATGEPVLFQSEYHKMRTEYDTRGNETLVEFFGKDLAPMRTSLGVHRITRAFDPMNQIISESYFGKHGEPVAIPTSGVHRVEFGYDIYGNQALQKVFGSDGRPTTDLVIGAHATIGEFYPNGAEKSKELYGESEEPIVGSDGIFRLESTLDDRGRIAIQKGYDVNGEPTLSVHKFHMVRYQYDEFDRVLSEAYFGLGEEPVLCLAGFHEVRYLYDRFGNRTRIEYYDETGMPIETSRVHSQHLAYDRFNRQIRLRYENADGNAVDGPAGWSVRAFTYGVGQDLELAEYRNEHGESLTAVLGIQSVVPGLTASLVGLRPGDIILEYGAWVYDSHSHANFPEKLQTSFVNAVRENDRTVSMKIARQWRLHSLEVPPGKLGVSVVAGLVGKTQIELLNSRPTQ